MPEAPIVRQIRTYAFNHGCGLDEATFKVLSETMWSLSNHKVDGLFDRLFKEGTNDDGQGKG